MAWADEGHTGRPWHDAPARGPLQKSGTHTLREARDDRNGEAGHGEMGMERSPSKCGLRGPPHVAEGSTHSHPVLWKLSGCPFLGERRQAALEMGNEGITAW